MYTKADTNPNFNTNAKPNTNRNPSSATRQFLTIEGGDNAADGELTAAITWKRVAVFEHVVISHMERKSWNACTETEFEYFAHLHDWRQA